MHPATVDEAKVIAKKSRLIAGKLVRTEVVACPPFAFIPASVSRTQAENFSIGAQSVSGDEGGAHTGEVGAAMLKSLGVSYVIAGHSEQRAAGDTDEMISRRIGRALDAGLSVIACVGEKVREESGSHFAFIKEQIKNSLANVSEDKRSRIILAYEPVWAIGAQDAMAPEQIYEMSLFVKKAFADAFGPEAGLKVKVLYGGSVNFRNAADIIVRGKVDGLLVGRESVNMPGFSELLKAVDGIGTGQAQTA
ncbi:MAG: triosephosphate isomerase, triosephosphate isomerase [Candidatus Parcubacteria bacterium]|nr:triosephosphate isomerase, triosephosphate isomerase [Candidatus Parcubacteria bacterium]